MQSGSANVPETLRGTIEVILSSVKGEYGGVYLDKIFMSLKSTWLHINQAREMLPPLKYSSGTLKLKKF